MFANFLDKEWRLQELEHYRRHAEERLLPFWRRASDEQYGGVFTCYSNEGDRLVSTDKFTWSQGRYLWLWSRIARMCADGLLGGNAGDYSLQARRTFEFLDRHAFLEDGTTCFLLTREGERKEATPGSGYHLSFYADCFVVLGYAEFARLTGDTAVLDKALRLYRNIEERLLAGQVRSEPYPVPPGYAAHGFSMIMLNVSQELADAAERLGNPAAATLRANSSRYMEDVMFRFRGERNDLIAEILPVAREVDPETLLARHINPGHSIECMWFVMHEANRQSRPDLIGTALDVVEATFEIGWDEQYGGLFRYVDRDGGPPRGARDGSRFDELVASTWDMKLWWPHSEALYTTLLGLKLGGGGKFAEMYRRVKEYTFRTFPHPDPDIGEWIQIRSRDGRPADTVVALPVKDPYHILRNVLLIIELLS
jgi:N-acylglucosamine 2-epimerase